MKVNEVKVITGDSKDYITMADLLISEDGENFVKVGKFDDLGQASATPDAAKTIKAVKIQITGQHTCWPIIKGNYLEIEVLLLLPPILSKPTINRTFCEVVVAKHYQKYYLYIKNMQGILDKSGSFPCHSFTVLVLIYSPSQVILAAMHNLV